PVEGRASGGLPSVAGGELPPGSGGTNALKVEPPELPPASCTSASGTRGGADGAGRSRPFRGPSNSPDIVLLPKVVHPPDAVSPGGKGAHRLRMVQLEPASRYCPGRVTIPILRAGQNLMASIQFESYHPNPRPVHRPNHRRDGSGQYRDRSFLELA